MLRKLLLTLLLYILGAAVYLSLSRAPLRVHVVELPFHFVFLGLAVLVASASSINRPRRGIALALLVLVGSILLTILSSRVIHALYPVHPLYFVGSFALLVVELLVVLGLVWLLDRGLASATRPRQPSEPRSPPS